MLSGISVVWLSVAWHGRSCLFLHFPHHMDNNISLTSSLISQCQAAAAAGEGRFFYDGEVESSSSRRPLAPFIVSHPLHADGHCHRSQR